MPPFDTLRYLRGAHEGLELERKEASDVLRNINHAMTHVAAGAKE